MKRPLGKSDSESWIEASGLVTRLLHDALEEDERHQRFVVDTGLGRTVLVAHNVDLAERVPVGIGDRIRFRGFYEWNDRGGTIHWTHRDPMNIEPGGYIEFRRRTYR